MKLVSIQENHLFSKAYQRGKKCVTRCVVVYVLRDYKAEQFRRANPAKQRINRIGLTVTKKLGGAVVRSRVRRILREGYYAVCRTEQIRTGNLIVIVARDAAVEAKSGAIANDLRHAFRKLGLLENLTSGSRTQDPT